VTWLRLEGSTRDPDLVEGLAARVADPLWTLARQWQVGEFHGEDAASPIIVDADVAVTPITAFAPGSPGDGSGPLLRADADRPLEVLVEQEPVADDVRLSLDLGWTLLRSLFATGVPAEAIGRLRQQYHPRLQPDDGRDPTGRAQLDALARRSVDGSRIARDLAAEPGRAAVLALLGADVPAGQAIRQVVLAWAATAADLVRIPNVDPSWRTGPLEYRFRVAAPLAGDAELALSASEYLGRTLDWYHFRRAPWADPLGATGEPGLRSISVLPAPLRFHGMPAARFWAVEDETVSFGDLVGGPEDLVRAVVGGFAAVYANDWTVVPCHLPTGSVARVVSLRVLDDYGQRHDIPAAAVRDGADRVWRFFEVEGDDGPDAPLPPDRLAPLLLVAPALPDTEEGPPLERVDMIRDQVANLAWAIERRAVAGSGRPVDRDAAAAPPPVVDHGDDWYYEAFTPVPENWIPLVPVRRNDDGADNDGEVHLRRGRMAVPAPGVAPERLLPLGRILDAGTPFRVQEAAIPDAGLRLDRRYQRARDADGCVHLWLGRRVRTGAWPTTAHFTTDRLRRPPPASSR
jgi:hypothetical protein